MDAIVTTHGDADHFIGLAGIIKSETNTDCKKRLFMFPKGVYHNGIVKGPSKLKYDKIFGQTVDYNKKEFIVGLEEDNRTVSQSKMNEQFKEYVRTLNH